VIVYGVMQTGAGHASFSPEFYVNYKGFQEGGEITGQHEFGENLSIPLPFDFPKFNAADNPALSARTQALSLMAIGLAYYSVDNFEKASDYFFQSENISGWPNLPGKEVIYLLVGNTYNRWYSVEKSPMYLVNALDNYNTALQLNENYARAMVGKAGSLYLQALGNPDDNDFTTLDLDKLEEAAGLYETALRLNHAPESANIEAKVNFGLGKINFIRYLWALSTKNEPNTFLSKADAEFHAVLKEFNDGKGNVRIENLSGHSYAFLGAMARVQHQYPEAVELYRHAIEHVSPYYQSYYNTRLGETYLDGCQLDLAIQAYEQAIQIAKFYGFEKPVLEDTNRLEKIKKTPCPAGSK
jgi:tetratricopeptide (TPR) repeat protein